MLNSPARNAKATASAPPMKGVERASEAATRSPLPNMPRSEGPVGLDRVLADGEDEQRRTRTTRHEHGPSERDAGPAGAGRRRVVRARRRLVARPRGLRVDAAGHEQPEVARGGGGPVERARPARRGRSRRSGRPGSAPRRARPTRAARRRPGRGARTISRWMNSIDPTSSPRVGWATTSSFGSPVSSRAMITFCWLPPDSVEAATSGLGVRTSKRATRSQPDRGSAAVLAEAAAGEGPLAVAVEHEVVADR